MAGGGVCTLLLSGDRWCQIAHPANNLGGESRNTIVSIYLLDKINPIRPSGGQGPTGSRYPTRPELFFKYPTRPDPKIENDWVPGN